MTQAADARIIHLFTHAVANDSTGSQPLLFFADSTLQLADLGADAVKHVGAQRAVVGRDDRGSELGDDGHRSRV